MHTQDRFSRPTLVRRNRRAYPRLPADQLGWLKRVRLAYGPAVSLIDLSVQGAFFEVDYRLRPGDTTDFELMAADEQAVVTGHIVRTEISGLNADVVRYRGACAFERNLPWEGQLSPPAACRAPGHPAGRLSAMVRVERGSSDVSARPSSARLRARFSPIRAHPEFVAVMRGVGP